MHCTNKILVMLYHIIIKFPSCRRQIWLTLRYMGPINYILPLRVSGFVGLVHTYSWVSPGCWLECIYECLKSEFRTLHTIMKNRQFMRLIIQHAHERFHVFLLRHHTTRVLWVYDSRPTPYKSYNGILSHILNTY